MDRLVGLRAFVAAARQGSFAAAGRSLGLTRDQVSKAMADLERQVRTPLFVRSTRAVQLTAAGSTYLERVASAVEALDRADQLLQELDATPCGKLAVHGPASFGVVVLAPLAASFLEEYEQIQLELCLDDRLLEPLPSDVDIVVRVSGEPGAYGAAEAVGEVSRGLYASPAYLARAGEPSTPEDLARHSIAHYTGSVSGAEWVLHRGRESRAVTVSPRFASPTGMAVAAAACGGIGIALMPTFLAAQYEQRGELVQVLRRWSPPSLRVWAITHVARQHAPKIRAYVDHLRTALQEKNVTQLSRSA